MTTNSAREHTVTAAVANRQFSQLLREVRDGNKVVITSHGRPVARLAPFDSEAPARQPARIALFHRLERQPARNIGFWSRDELYDV